jgi:hypothetical protein
MKKFNQVKTVLFDSTIASFKVSIEANFNRNRPDGSASNLAYVSDKGTANMNPSIYLVFAYKGENYESSKTLYTSYPQLFKIRRVFEQIKDLIIDNKGFMDVQGVLTVHPDHQKPLVISEIGKNKKWISFTLAAVDMNSDSVQNKVPGVAIQISDSEFSSVLTSEEFLTVYTIVKDIDLSSIQTTLSAMFLLGEDSGVHHQMAYGPQPAYQQPVYQQQPAPQYAQQPQQQQQRPASNPRYGNNPMQRPQPQVRTMPAQQVSPSAPQTASVQSQPSGLPPRREEKTIVNMKAVSETPVSPVNFDDEKAIEEIFNDEN